MATPPSQVPEYVYNTPIRPFIDYSVPVLDEDAPVKDALVAVGRGSHHTVLLTKSKSRQLAGIITTSDLARIDKMGDDFASKRAQDIATKSPGVLGIRYDAMLWELLRLINGENSFKRPLDKVPVLDQERQIVGLIERDDLNRKMLQIESTGRPPPA